ncbi:MAG: hypothetical protein ACM3PP_05115 [Candidatus Saccharibacteria bacterium]
MGSAYKQHYKNEEEETSSWSTWFWVALVVIFVVWMVWEGLQPEPDYDISEVKLIEAPIVEMNSEEGYWVRASVQELPTTDDEWVEVSSDFYNRKYVGQTCVLLLGKCSEMQIEDKDNKLTIGTDNPTWQILDIYDSVEQAQAANPPVSFTMQAKLLERLKSTGGRYFAMDAEGREFMVDVAPDYYERFKPGDEFTVKFEGWGDYNHCTGIVSPQ